MESIKARLRALETQLACKPVPSFEEWKTQWASMDELSKSLILAEVSHPKNIEVLHPDSRSRDYARTVGVYLRKMGLVVEAEKSILDIAKEMDSASE